MATRNSTRFKTTFSNETIQAVNGMQAHAARIGGHALTLQPTETQQYIAGAVFELVERMTKINHDFAMVTAKFMTHEIRKQTDKLKH